MKKAYPFIMRKYITAAFAAAGILVICAAVLLFMGNFVMASIQGGIGLLILTHIFILRFKRKKAVMQYLHRIIDDDNGISENAIVGIPLPMTVCSIDGTIKWYNNKFLSLFKDKKLPDEMLDNAIHDLKWSEVLKHPDGEKMISSTDGNIYRVKWCMLKDKIMPNQIGEHYSVFFYFTDVTREKYFEDAYENDRTDIAIINIDNYDEFAQKTDDDVVDAVVSKIRAAIIAWGRDGKAVIKKTDRDRYFAVFEHKYLEKYINSKFDVIEKVREITESVNFQLSISMGIGTGGDLAANEVSARTALDMSLGRGGDQVCVKDLTQFRFYGGKNKEYERSTRVKARAVASAFADFVKKSDSVIFMGHHAADFDCFGAAIGLQRAARALGKTPYIVLERNASNAIQKMYDEIKDIEEYRGMFIDENEVLEEITENSLLVILDTHRPSMLPNKRLLERTKKIVLIDHHRRSTEFISPCSLVYHEPYASSTCEMVTEMLDYMDVGNKVTKMEAQCLYTGIIMDTKNFMLKTGVRTFEAASYLRKLGLDTVSVRRMFSMSLDEYSKRAEIVDTAVMASPGIAVARAPRKDKNMRVIASQAADEMLNLNNVRASVVAYPSDGGIGVSARSLGDINVQLICEKLGGGGHMTVAGAIIKHTDMEKALDEIGQAVKAYVAESQ